MDRSKLLQLASCISLPSVRGYAATHGWEPVSGSNRRIWLFRHPENHLIQLQIPMDRDDDAAEAVLESATRIARLERRGVDVVIEDLASVNSDVLRFRKISEHFKGGSIPLDEAIGLFAGAKYLLSSVACSIANPVTHHTRTDRIEARQLIQHARMGQTEIGSFIVKIICPLDSVDSPPLFSEVHPFTRTVTTFLMNATGKLIRGIEDGSIDTILDDQSRKGARPEITSNLCKGLLDLRGGQESGDVELSVQWASMIQLQPPTAPSVIRIPVEYFAKVEQVHRMLRPS